jgi:hypothetical protein
MSGLNRSVTGIMIAFLLHTGLFAGDETFSLKLGGLIIGEQSTEVSLGRNAASVVLNLEDLSGMESENEVFRLDSYYRFNDRHRVEFSYYSLNSSGSKQTTKDIEWGDSGIIQAGAAVSAHFDVDMYKVNYTYSVYRTDKIEFGIGAGLHITGIDVGLNAQGTIDGVPSDTYNENSNVTAPLPVLGFRFSYDITSDLAANFNYDIFAIKVGDYKGNIQNTTLTIDYDITKNFGIGAGFDLYSLAFEAEKDSKILKVNRTVNGALVFLSYKY